MRQLKQYLCPGCGKHQWEGEQHFCPGPDLRVPKVYVDDDDDSRLFTKDEAQSHRAFVDAFFSSVPTGPWIEGNTPEEDGWYLCQTGEPTSSAIPPYFVMQYSNEWAATGYPIARYAKIQEATP